MLDAVKLLVRAGSDINAQNNDGYTPLMLTAKVGPKAAAIHEYFLSRPKIDTTIATKEGVTALHIASAYRDVDLVAKLIENAADVSSRALTVRSSPLIAACIPTKPESASDVPAILEAVESVVRELVSHGADINAMVGISVFSPLCAAAWCAGVGTINYLLDKSASVQKKDPLGRLPIHFAAANGIRNFKAIELVHDTDIMVSDRFDKNILHWASQFGHVETVRAIMQRLSPRDRKVYINAGDVDGWTPLAWASRSTYRDAVLCSIMSEQSDFAATIQCLLDHGADKSRIFRITQDEESVEEFTPSEMARQCGSDDAVLRLLQIEAAASAGGSEGSENKTEKAVSTGEKRYRLTDSDCDFCLSVRDQQLDYMFVNNREESHANTKSGNIANLGHHLDLPVLWLTRICSLQEMLPQRPCRTSKTVNDQRPGEEHLFIIEERNMTEFQDRSPSVTLEAGPATTNFNGEVNIEQEKEGNKEVAATPTMNEGEYEIGQLDFPDLDGLEDLDGL